MYILTNRGKRRYQGLVLGARKRLSHGWQMSASYTHNNGRDNYVNSTDNFYSANGDRRLQSVDRLGAGRHRARVPSAHARSNCRSCAARHGALAAAFGGWQLNTIWNLQSGGFFIPTSPSGFGAGGDFNADGQRGERPDRPAPSVPRSYSQDEWLRAR